jgi:hypothetical protein
VDWLTDNKNRRELEKLQEKRATLIIDVTINNKYRNTYKGKLNRINQEIETLYNAGV